MISLMLAVLVLGGKPAAPREELQDALDFNNGAVMVSEAGSFASGVANWSAWRLTDGDEETGWCSAQNAPLGGTFEWELDGDWKLESLGLSTRHAEESSYPGISARTVDVYLAGASGSFTRAGSFTLAGKRSSKSFPLKGVVARRVRLVVKDNFGHKEYTQLGEVDLLGARTAPQEQATLSGLFGSTYGPIKFVQEKATVYGCYDWGLGAAQIWGSVQGRVARVVWYDDAAEGAPLHYGTATFSVRPDRSFWGVYYENGQIGGVWEGPPSEAAPACEPLRKAALAHLLRKTGRAALYGIHFATGKDVPLPESQSSLEELASALKEDRTLKVVVEGHTDSTNTDAFNLDLSRRRATSVMEWLKKNGVAADRLEARGFGKTMPVADNGTAQGRALNRRVEVALPR